MAESTVTDSDIYASLPPRCAQLLQTLLHGQPLNPFQRLALPYAARQDNLLVVAPTGKSLIGYAGLFAPLAPARLSVYVAPMRSIAAEKAEDLAVLQRSGLAIYQTTGDTDRFDLASALRADLIVATPERLDAILRGEAAATIRPRLACIVIDEFHTITNGTRGARLEALVVRLRTSQPPPRLIAMSGTIANPKDIAAWLDATLLHSTWRPVPIDIAVRPYPPIDDPATAERARNKLAADTIATLCTNRHAALIFCSSRQGAQRCALDIAELLHPPPIAPPPALRNPELRAALRKGTAFYHSGLSNQDRAAVQQLFRSGTLTILSATSSLAQGVNLPAYLVIVRDLTLGLQPMRPAELLQALGRAGRPGLESKGIGIVLAPTDHETVVRAMLAGEAIQSSLHADLLSALNAAIATSPIRTKHGLRHWYDATLHAKQHAAPQLVDRAVATLYRHQLITIDATTGIAPTGLGTATSRTMLSVPTAIAIDRALHTFPFPNDDPDRLDDAILRLVCGLSEEWPTDAERPETSQVTDTLAALDPALKDWPPGRLRLYASALFLANDLPAADLPITDSHSLASQLRADIPRHLALIAQRALQPERALPHIAIAAANLASAIQAATAWRGAGAALELLTRGRRRNAAHHTIREQFEALQPAQFPSRDALLDHPALRALPSATWLRQLPSLNAANPAPNLLLACTTGQHVHLALQQRVAATPPAYWTACLPLTPSLLTAISLDPRAGPPRLIAIDRNPLLWTAPLPFQTPPARPEHAIPAPSGIIRPYTWDILQHYLRPGPRRLPIATALCEAL